MSCSDAPTIPLVSVTEPGYCSTALWGQKQYGEIDQWVTDIAPSTALRKWFGDARLGGMSLPGGCGGGRSIGISNISAGYVSWQDKVRSPSYSWRMSEVHNALPCGIVFLGREAKQKAESAHRLAFSRKARL
jgi:hypothetical protein